MRTIDKQSSQHNIGERWSKASQWNCKGVLTTDSAESLRVARSIRCADMFSPAHISGSLS